MLTTVAASTCRKSSSSVAMRIIKRLHACTSASARRLCLRIYCLLLLYRLLLRRCLLCRPSLPPQPAASKGILDLSHSRAWQHSPRRLCAPPSSSKLSSVPLAITWRGSPRVFFTFFGHRRGAPARRRPRRLRSCRPTRRRRSRVWVESVPCSPWPRRSALAQSRPSAHYRASALLLAPTGPKRPRPGRRTGPLPSSAGRDPRPRSPQRASTRPHGPYEPRRAQRAPTSLTSPNELQLAFGPSRPNPRPFRPGHGLSPRWPPAGLGPSRPSPQAALGLKQPCPAALGPNRPSAPTGPQPQPASAPTCPRPHEVALGPIYPNRPLAPLPVALCLAHPPTTICFSTAAVGQ